MFITLEFNKNKPSHRICLEKRTKPVGSQWQGLSYDNLVQRSPLSKAPKLIFPKVMAKTHVLYTASPI